MWLWFWSRLADVERELGLLPMGERRGVWAEARVRMQAQPGLGLVSLAVSCAATGLILIAAPLAGTVAFWIAFGMHIVLVFGGSALVLHLFRSRMQRFLRLELRARGFRICLACGYELRGLENAARCPECGTIDLLKSGFLE